MHGQEERLGNHPVPAPVDQLRELGIHAAQQIQILRADKQREVVHRIAAHFHAHPHLFLPRGRGRHIVLDGLYLDRRVVFGKKYGGKEAIVQTGEGIIAGGEHRTVFHRLGILGEKLALAEAQHAGFMRIEIDGVLFRATIQDGSIAKTSAPLDQVVGGHPVDGYFSFDLR